MSPRFRQVLFALVSAGFGAGLLWLALRGVDAAAALAALQTARYGWLPVLLALTAASLVVRAWRWRLLLEAVPAAGGAAPVTLGTAVWAVTLGYGLNLVVPRAGEVARAGAVAARGPLGFAAVFGTVVVERVLDVIAFALVILLALALYADRLVSLRRPFAERLAGLTESLPALGVMLLVGAVLLVALAIGGAWALQRSGRGARLLGKGREMAQQFGSGLRTAWLVQRRVGLIGSTVLLLWGVLRRDGLRAALAARPRRTVRSFLRGQLGADGRRRVRDGDAGARRHGLVPLRHRAGNGPPLRRARDACGHVRRHHARHPGRVLRCRRTTRGAARRDGVAREARRLGGRPHGVAMTRRVLACLLVLTGALSGCEGCSRPGPGADAPTQVLPIGGLDTLGGGDYDGVVSIGGVVLETDEREVLLQDGSGLVRVRLRETPPTLDGQRLLVQGLLQRDGDGLRVDADEWLFDSTRTEP